MTTLFLDLDGVLADFDGAFPVVFGMDHKSMADEDMWEKINAHPSFFRDLPPMPGALEFFRKVEHLDPIILTACPKNNYAHVAKQKREWVREHLSDDVLVLPVMGGSNKPLFMRHEGDILIDDFIRNVNAWEGAGGVGILHHDFALTEALLRGRMLAGRVNAGHWERAVQDGINRIYNKHAAQLIAARANELAEVVL